jgi:hypothetical protein
MISTSLLTGRETLVCDLSTASRGSDKPWKNGRVKSMNLWLDRALMRHDISHIGEIDTPSIVREDDTMHGRHLNSQGKKRLTQLIAERVVDHVSGTSTVPVITHARTSPIYSLNSKAQKCLTYINCSPAVFEVHKQNAGSSTSINISPEYQRIQKKQ